MSATHLRVGQPAGTNAAMLAVTAFCASATAIVATTLTDTSEDHQGRRLLVEFAMLLAVTGIVGLVTRRGGRKAAYALAALAVLTLPAFWLGITPVLAAGAIIVGRPVRAGAASTLGWVAMGLFIVLVVADAAL
jgi:hypothetical protein